jgi:hypothetical protein
MANNGRSIRLNFVIDLMFVNTWLQAGGRVTNGYEHTEHGSDYGGEIVTIC